MAHPSHKIAGPMLRTVDLRTGATLTPATPEQVRDALSFPNAWIPTVVADEWVNASRRLHGIPGTSEIAGAKFRTDQELRHRPKQKIAPKPKLSRLQRIARRITRLFSK